VKWLANFLPYVILTAVSLIVLYLIFGVALWRPNDFAFMVGGDGNVIYYNIFYHTLYGSGVTLASMNYPDPDSILLTDAQGMIAIALNKLNTLFPWISGHVLGIVHVTIMLSIWLQYIVLYKVIKRIDAPTWMAILFAICIGTLAPQLVRISYGHLGLTYPFLIPLAILWLWHIEKQKVGLPLTIVFVLLTLFFGFNNPYLLVSVAILLLCYGAVDLLQTQFRKLKGGVPILFGVGFLLILFVVTSWLDPFQDRIQHQWGHFYYASTIEGILWGRYSLLNKVIEFIGLPYVGRSEARASISLISFLICIIGAGYGINQYIKTRQLPWQHPSAKLTMAAGISFLYASSFLQSKWWYWLASDSGIVTMIKATGRLSWITYYALSLLSVFIIIKVFRKLPTTLSYILILIIGVVWLAEGYIYVTQHTKVSLYSNHYALSHLDGYIKKKKEAIDFSKFQALYTVPVFQSWNDNILTEGDWPTEVHAIAISSATGLPLINSKLSRAPVGRSLENIQLSSDPIIYKTLPEKLDKALPVLLLKMNSTSELTTGEEFLIDQSTTLYSDDQLSLYELWPKDINSSNYDVDELEKCTSNSWYYYNGFNTNKNECGKVGEGGKSGEHEWQEIDKFIVPDSIEGRYELSIWSRVNVKKAGMPFFELFVYNSAGQQKSYNHYDSRISKNNQHGWSQFQVEIAVLPEDQIILKGRGNYTMCVDELLFRPIQSGNTCIQTEEGNSLINNIYIEDRNSEL